MIRLSSVIESLGSSVVCSTAPARRDRVTDVVLAVVDGVDSDGCGHLVLGPGIQDGPGAVELLRSAARTGACAVVLPAPTASDTHVVREAESLGVGLVELQPTTSWTQLVWLVRSLIDHSTAGVGSAAYGEPVGDPLFVLADAAAAVVRAPVTIEDVHSRVLAYSELQGTTDAARISTIVGRRVPENVIRHFRSRGTLRRLHGCDAPIRIESGPEGLLPRLVVPVRAGRELLGSIWIVDPDPMSTDQLRELTRIASVVALHLVRLRAHSGIAQRMSADRLRTLLLSPDDAGTFPLPPGPWRVTALWSRTGDSADASAALADGLLRRHGWRRPLLTTIEGVAVAVLTDHGSAQVAGGWEWLRAAVTAADHSTVSALAGAPAHSPAELPRSCSEAMELAAVVQQGHLRTRSTAFEDAWPDIALARARSALRATPLDVRPVRALIDHDTERGSNLAATLATYLDHYGEPKRAARELHVHPNTLRYRLRQISGLSALDLTDPRVRLATALVLDSLAHGPTAARTVRTAALETAVPLPRSEERHDKNRSGER